MNYPSRIAPLTGIPARKIESVITLLEGGATIPFIARYRKEATGELDEVQIGDIQDAWKKMQELDKRRETILQSIEEQGKLTPELKKAIEEAATMTELEDLYLPYRPKRKTRASIAIEKGLEPLAKRIFQQRDREVETLAAQYITDQVPTVEEALQGARDIIAEWVSEDLKARDKIRRHFTRDAQIGSRLIEGTAKKMAEDFFSAFAAAVEASAGPSVGEVIEPITPADEAMLSAEAKAAAAAPVSSTTPEEQKGLHPAIWITGLVAVVGGLLYLFAKR